MKVFAYVVHDAASPRKKIYAGVLLPNGRVAYVYGGTDPLSLRLRSGDATVRYDVTDNNSVASAINEISRALRNKNEYTSTPIPGRLYDVNVSNPNNPVAVVEALWSNKSQLDTGGSVVTANSVEGFVTQARNATRESNTRQRDAERASEADTNITGLRLDGPFLRPNGQEYRPRMIGVHQDVALLRALFSTQKFVRLAGPAGSGKTALLEAAHPDAITILGHGDMTVAHFVGSLVPDGANWRWEDGPLTRAMKEGKPLYVDEVLRIPNEVLAILYGAMDGRSILRLDDAPGAPVVHAAPGFGVIASYNPDAHGGRMLDEALLSRFVIGIEVSTDYDTARLLGVPEKAITLAKNLSVRNREDRAQGGLGYWTPQMRDLLTFRDLMLSGLGEEFAVGALLSACPRPEDLPLVAEIAQSTFGFTPTALASAGRG